MTLILNGTTGLSDVDGTAAAPAIRGTDADTGLYFPAANEVAAAAGGSSVWNASSTFGFKNRIINGGMGIDQRNAGASFTPSSGAYTYSLDRWFCYATQSSKYTVQQNAGSVTPPTGFRNYLGVTSSSAYAITASDIFMVGQRIEGFNIADLGWGAAGAQTVTLSFWVRSSLTGTFGGTVNADGQTYNYPFTYTISAANTWEQKSVTIPGPTGGTWVTNNGIGLQLNFGLGVGSTTSGTAGSWQTNPAGNFSATGATSVVGTNGATFYITGVQLERGSVATSFDFRDYGRELMLCQRYLPAFPVTAASWRLPAVGLAPAGSTVFLTITFPTTTRVPATGMVVSSAGHWVVGVDGLVGSVAFSTLSFSFLASNNAARITGVTVSSPFSTGQVVAIDSASASANMYFTGCEL